MRIKCRKSRRNVKQKEDAVQVSIVSFSFLELQHLLKCDCWLLNCPCGRVCGDLRRCKEKEGELDDKNLNANLGEIEGMKSATKSRVENSAG